MIICILLIIILLLLVYRLYSNLAQKQSAIAIFPINEKNISGHVHFLQAKDNVVINVNIRGLSDGKHGFHIHKKGSLSDKCMGSCAHYDPHNVNHGGLNNGHAGDLGNIISENGVCTEILKTNKFKLSDVMGRTIVVHGGEDDLGLYNGPDINLRNESLITGNSGERVTCAIIL